MTINAFLTAASGLHTVRDLNKQTGGENTNQRFVYSHHNSFYCFGQSYDQDSNCNISTCTGLTLVVDTILPSHTRLLYKNVTSCSS